ncbi:MAG: hypothetical protein O9310_09200 [Leptospiraceae bacterium]|nr:hypothetical protein [Leptospiraceae bacterium]
MALDFGTCLKGAKQSGRKIRFVVDYKSLPFEPKISKNMVSRYGFINNVPRKRFSVLVDPNKTFQCQFSTKIITEDPLAEVFYNDVLTANQTSLFTGEMLKPFFSYYVMDESGWDMPGIPGLDDFKSSTGINSIKSLFNDILMPVALLAAAYFGYPFYKDIFETKGKRRK